MIVNKKTRNRSVSSLSHKSKKLLTSLVEFKKQMFDDHNIYHFRNDKRRKHTSLERRNPSRQVDANRRSFVSSSHIRRQSQKYDRSVAKDRKSPRVSMFDSTERIPSRADNYYAVNYGVTSDKKMSQSGSKAKQQAAMRSNWGPYRKPTTPMGQSTFHHYNAMFNQVTDSGVLGNKVLVDSNLTITENNETPHNVKQ